MLYLYRSFRFLYAFIRCIILHIYCIISLTVSCFFVLLFALCLFLSWIWLKKRTCLFLSFVTRCFNRWTAEDETITFFFILFLNFVSVFHLLSSIPSFISMRVSGCYPLFNFLASIYLEKPKKTRKSKCSWSSDQHAFEIGISFVPLPYRLTCSTFVYCMCTLLRIVCVCVSLYISSRFKTSVTDM